MFEHWLDSDLSRFPEVKQLEGRVFSQDSNANKIGVRVTNNGQAVALSGTVKANIIRADKTTVEVTGSLDENKAYVILPASAYTVVGRIGIYLRIELTEQVITLGGIESYVYPAIVGQTIT